MGKIILLLITHYLILTSVNAQVWHSLDGGVNGTVFCFKVYNNQLLVGGAFLYSGLDTNGGSNAIHSTEIAKWNGSNWDSIRNHNYGGAIFAIEVYNDTFYVGGNFHKLGINGYLDLAKITDNGWEAFGNIGLPNAFVQAFRIKNKLYLSGDFNYFEYAQNMNHIACFDGNYFSRLGSGLQGGFGHAYDIEEYNDQLIVGGSFDWAGDTSAYSVAAWDGNTWYPLDTGLLGTVYALAVDSINNFLYAGGTIDYAGGNGDMIRIHNIARWDGYEWTPVGNDSGSIFFNGILALKFYHNYLFAGGGAITGTADDTVLVKWDVAKWNKIDGPNNTIECLEVYNDELFVGGYFDKIIDSTYNHIASYYEPPDTSCNYLQAILYPQNTTYYIQDSIGVQFYNNIANASYWHWDFEDGITDSIQKPLHYYDSAGIFPVSVIVQYQNCIDTASSLITIMPCDSLNAFIHAYNDTLTYAWSNPPAAAFYSNPNADSWQWNFGDGTTGTGFSNSHNYDTAGTYTISVIVTFGNCIDTGYATITIINTAGLQEYTDNITYLWQNIPNPFDNTTSIPYYVPYGSKGLLQITDVKGEMLDEYALQQGKNKLEVSLEYLKAGTYFYSIVIDGKVMQTKKMILE